MCQQLKLMMVLPHATIEHIARGYEAYDCSSDFELCCVSLQTASHLLAVVMADHCR